MSNVIPLRYSRRYEHNGVEYTVSNNGDGTVSWKFHTTLEVPFAGTVETFDDAMAEAQKHIDTMKGARGQ